MSRHRSAAKLVNMSGKQTYDDIVNFLCNESKMNHIVIKLQIIDNPLSRGMRFRWNTNYWCISVCISDGGCPSVGQPRQHIICYYDGKRPVSSLNVCLCTHLIYTSVGIDEYGKLHLSEGMLIYIHLNLAALKLLTFSLTVVSFNACYHLLLIYTLLTL